MKTLHKYPVVRILVPYIIGILSAFQLSSYPPLPLYLFLILTSILLITILILNKYPSYRQRWIKGMLIYICFIMTGYFITINNYENHKADYFGNYITTSKSLAIADINEPIEIKAKTVKALVKVIYITDTHNKDTPANLIATSGKTIIYLQKDSLTLNLRYGDRLMINANFKEIPPPQLLSDINYKRYFAFKNIYHQAFVRRENVMLLSRDHVNPVYYYAYLTGNKIIRILKENGVSGKELAVGVSLIFGYREFLSPETIREYSDAGVIHILCVSGLNVGIIYIFCSSLLFFLDRNRNGKYVKLIILLLMIWFYTFICGLSPSILRASAMFTFIITGKIFNRDADILNSLIVSAFVLLLYNPFFLADIGFQLSYLSVTGIVLLCPILEKLISSKNPFVIKVWQLNSISVAAQIAVSPLVIYYFHFIPVYFIFTNLIIIPLTFIITYAGCSLLIINPLLLSSIAAFIFIRLIRVINYVVWSVQLMPFCTIDNIYINVFQLIMIYLLIIFLIISLLKRNKQLLKISLIMSLVLSISITFKI